MEQCLFTPRGGKWNDTVDTQFGRLLQRPLERIEFYDRQEQRRLKRRCPAGNWLYQFEGHFVASGPFDASNPCNFTVAQFVKLSGLRAKNSPEVMRRIAGHNCRVSAELFNEESSA